MKIMPYASGCSGFFVCRNVADAVNGPFTIDLSFQ